jgi:muramidase (phage lysozyme)
MDNSSEITQATATLRQLNNLYNGLNETINKVEDDYNNGIIDMTTHDNRLAILTDQYQQVYAALNNQAGILTGLKATSLETVNKANLEAAIASIEATSKALGTSVNSTNYLAELNEHLQETNTHLDYLTEFKNSDIPNIDEYISHLESERDRLGSTANMTEDMATNNDPTSFDGMMINQSTDDYAETLKKIAYFNNIKEQLYTTEVTDVDKEETKIAEEETEETTTPMIEDQYSQARAMTDDEIKASQEKMAFTNNADDIEYIPNTNIPRPRARDPYETDDEYVTYLKNYYGKYFPIAKEQPTDKSILKPVPEEEIQTPKDEKQEPEGEKSIPIGEEPIPERGKPIPEREEPIPERGKPISEREEPVPEREEPIPEEEQPTPAIPPTSGNTNKESIDHIMAYLTKGLKISVKDDKHYEASSIQPYKIIFNNEQVFNYNCAQIFGAPVNLLTATAAKVYKTINQLLLTKQAKKDLKELENRLDKMSYDDPRWDTLYHEFARETYKHKESTAITRIITSKIANYVQYKEKKISEQLTNNYITAITDYKTIVAIDERLTNDKNLSDNDRRALVAAKNKLLSGKAQLIGNIRNLQHQGEEMLSSGLHGLEEDVKVSQTKMSYLGLRKSSGRIDDELKAQFAFIQDNEQKAVRENNDMAALKNFIIYERLSADNDTMKKSIFGNRETGATHYSPFPTKLDYRNDPYVQYIGKAIASVGVMVALGTSIGNYVAEQRMLAEHNAEINSVNAHNSGIQTEINNTGKDLQANAGTYQKGAEALGKQSEYTKVLSAERHSLDSTNWDTTSQLYHNLDSAAHTSYDQLNSTITTGLKNIHDNLASGKISAAQASNQTTALYSQVQSQINNSLPNIMGTFKAYQAAHPDIHLGAYADSLQYMVDHPQDITNMLEAANGTLEAGVKLSSMQVQAISTLQSLPSSILPPIAGTLGVLGLAYNTKAEMSLGINNDKNKGMQQFIQNTEKQEAVAKSRVDNILKKSRMDKNSDLNDMFNKAANATPQNANTK